MTEHWKLDGTYMEACTCDVVCPCNFLSDPTEGTCTDVVAWHIDRGYYGNVFLDDLNVALALHTPGNMARGDWKAALYLDDRANPEQQEALTNIFGGQAGGHPAELAKFVAEVRGVSTVRLEFETDGKQGRLRVGEVGSIEVEPLVGQGGKAPTIENAPLAVGPGYPAVVAKSRHARFNDHGIALDVVGRNAMLSPFSYYGPSS